MLLALAVHPSAGEDRLSAMLLDLDRASEEIARAPRDAADWQDALENRLFEGAIQSPPALVSIHDEADLVRHFGTLLDGPLEPLLSRVGHLKPFGEIEIALSTGGPLALELDGQRVGTVREGTMRLLEVQPGARTLSLRSDDGAVELRTERLTVERGQVARWSPDLGGGSARYVVPIGAAILTVGGGALAIWAAVKSPKPVYGTPCIGACTDRRSFASFCDLSSGDPSRCRSGPRGVLVAPLGIAISALGAAAGIGSFFDRPEEGLPWWAIGAGLVAGVGSYALLAALDRS
jgi:hypothetical protein